MQELRMSQSLRRRRRSIDERGAIAIIMALSITTLLIISAMVLDFGLVRADRQVNKSAADSATAAGLANLGGSDGKPYPFRGVCSALRYLQKNDPRFAGATSSAGTWTDGAGTAKANGCTDATVRAQTCVPGADTSWARYTWTGTWQGEPIRVSIQSGYKLTGSGWQEEGLSAVAADADDGAQGCNQLAVTISQNRKPGLGSLATSSDLVSAVRTVGRVKAGPGGYAPAMLLLKRTGCPVLSTGSNSGGSFIRVYGAVSSNGKSQPGAIHADADGLNCSGGSGANIFWGRAANGIAAYAAPLVSNPSVSDPTKPGEISSVAVFNGVSPTSGIIRDSDPNVYASSGLNELDTTATKMPAVKREPVTRKPVDDRYLAGVHAAIDAAQSSVFSVLTAANAESPANGYTKVSDCNPSGTITATKLFIDCTDNNGYKGTAVLDAQTIVFNGRVNPSATISMPKATKVYVFGRPGFPAIDIGSGATVSMHTSGNIDSGKCTASRDGDKALLVVKDGSVKQTSGLLQLCNTTVLMMGGQPDGCLPTVGYTTTPPPMHKPCALASGSPEEGTGQLSQTGGVVDWTAPDQYDVMTLDNGDPDPAKAPAWSDPNGPEDLAFWSESGVSASLTYSMTGGGNLHTVGVYMVPNADPFIIGGGANQVLFNAQYIATSIALNGSNTSISMSVDANAAVTMPRLNIVGLVR